MKQIPLTQGKFAIVNDEDYLELIKRKWYAHRDGNYWYAYTGIKKNGKHTIIAMHRFLLNPPDGMEVDHINFNGLDNRRCNLRICTHTQNQQHFRKQKNRTSKYMGVSWNKKEECWYAQMRIEGKTKILIRCKNEIKAAKAYDKAVIKYHGEFANTNF